jgi:hypothetical protein
MVFISIAKANILSSPSRTMMEEEPTSGTVEEHADGAQIVSQLQDAALTDVTQGSINNATTRLPLIV